MLFFLLDAGIVNQTSQNQYLPLVLNLQEATYQLVAVSISVRWHFFTMARLSAGGYAVFDPLHHCSARRVNPIRFMGSRAKSIHSALYCRLTD